MGYLRTCIRAVFGAGDKMVKQSKVAQRDCGAGLKRDDAAGSVIVCGQGLIIRTELPCHHQRSDGSVPADRSGGCIDDDALLKLPVRVAFYS